MAKKYVQLVQIEIDGILVDAKECTKCGVVKSLDKYNAKSNGLGKKTSRCKECMFNHRQQTKHLKSEYDKKYREQNLEKIKEYQKKHYEENKEEYIEKSREYRLQNPDKYMEWYAGYREKNRDKLLKKSRDHYYANRESYSEYAKGYYKENRKSILERVSLYRQENREEILIKQRIYYHANPEKRIEYFKKNAEIIKGKRKKKYQENKEKYAERYKVYYSNNKVYHRERGRKYYFENWERSREKNKQWFKDNPERAQANRLKRRARERMLPDSITEEQIKEINTFFGGCALTKETEDIHMDHVVPIATGRGGSLYGNIIPLKGSLNESKRDKNIFEWFEQSKENWDLSQDKFNKLIEYLAEQNEMAVEEYKEYVYWCHENPVQMDIDVENRIVQLSLL